MSRNYTSFFESISVTSITAGAGADVVFTIPANHDAEIEFMSVSSGLGTNGISIEVFNADNSDYTYILRDLTMTANTYERVITSATIHLHAGDKVVAYKGAGTFDVSISGKLFYNPVRNI
jgi:hypothetical protein